MAEAFDKETAQPDAPAPEQKPFVSHGHRVHNEITYRGIDWLLNSTFGVAFTLWSTRTDSGKKYFSRPLTKHFEAWFKPVLGKSAGSGAKYGVDFISIMFGGFMIIPIMMLMENKKFKKGFVHWMDEKMYGKETVASDPRFAEAYKKIDEEPVKGFWAGMTSRIIALAPLFTLTVIEPTHDFLNKWMYTPIAKATQAAVEAVGVKPKGFFLKNEPNSGKKPSNNWEFLHYLIGFDFGLTVLYSFMHESAYKTLAALGVKQEKGPVHIVPPSLHAATPEADQPSAAIATSAKWAEGVNTDKPRPEKAASHVQAVEARASGEQIGLA